MPETTDYQGCRLTYERHGRGTPVVFIQGVGVHGNGWKPQTDLLQQSFECLSFDNRGMAASQPVALPLTVEQMAADTAAVMDAAGFSSAHIVGHSLGGVIAQQLALTHRNRVKSLALLCTSARGADATRLAWKILWLGTRSRLGTRRMRRLAFLEIVLSANYRATQDLDEVARRLEPLFGHDLADTPEIVMPQLRALKRFDATPRLNELAGIPALVISAAHDVIFPPRFGRALATAIPGARYMEFPDAAHGVPIEQPGAVNEALRQHIVGSSDSKTS